MQVLNMQINKCMYIIIIIYVCSILTCQDSVFNSLNHINCKKSQLN